MEKNLEEMLENEQKNVMERIGHLEKRVQQQDDEIICLKSTLADVLRRLQNVENNLTHQQQSTAKISPRQTTTSSLNVTLPNKPKTVQARQERNGSKIEQNLIKSVSKTSLNDKPQAPSTSTRKAPSTSSSHESSASHSNIKELVSFNRDSGTMKLYLHGRPIVLHIQNSILNNADFNIDAKHKQPKEQLKLEWVHGYRGKDCRTNIFQLPTGEIIYFIAATIVLYNVEERQQRHYVGHNDDVKCLTVHPDRVTIASGQLAGHESRAHVRIWDSVNLNTITTLGIGSAKANLFQNSICCLSFSKFDGGQQLCVIDDGPEKILSIWNWRAGTKLSSTKCYNDFVFGCEYHSVEKNLIVSCGKQHIFFWSIDDDSQHLVKKSGIFDAPFKVDKPKYILCVAITHTGEIVSGDSDGNLLFWNHKQLKISRVVKDAHDGGVFTILSYEQNDGVSMVTGGGKDGKIVEWSNEYTKTGRVLQIPEQYGTCRFITHGQGNLLVVGTTKNSILQGNFDMGLNCIVTGHVEELWGLTVHPREPYYLTCGNDRNIFFWDSLSHSLVWSLQLDSNEQQGAGLHCADYHPELNLVAIGLTKPKWAILDINERKIIYFQIEGTEQIECIQWSPNGQYLACGSRDNSIYVYTVSDNGTKYSRIGRCHGHSSFIKHIDWSIDSQHIMSNSGDYEILYWQATTCKQLTQIQQIRELEFSTNNCTLSANTIGIWNSSNDNQDQQDGTDINASSISNSRELLACVDDFGKVNLFTYPCLSTQKCEKRQYGGHSSHVTNVKFLNNDTRLISTGGNDMAIFEWSVLNE